MRFFLKIPAGCVAAIALVSARMALCESADDTAFFESRVRPVLVEQCYKCHSAQSKKLKGALRLDSREGLLKGGDTGPAIVPGDPDKSLLVQAIHRIDKETAMPPDDPLPAKDVETLTAWVKMGAPWPGGDKPVADAPMVEAKKHWAFQPVRMPEIPKMSAQLSVLSSQPEQATARSPNTGQWALSTNPLDALVLKKLAAKNLTPSPQADKRTLIRRATFDLTGLPPTAEEIGSFEKDTAADAFERVVDRLLASPRYGERWGRYWLDVARYADTKGYVFKEERRYPFAYTYRDWVIRALNEDMPCDKFLTLQIAADHVVTGDDKRDLAALGFLTVGRRFLNNPHEIIDDRIDVVCRGTMALTVGCARCHNHKFDPIPTADYYSLYGVFADSKEPKELPLLGEPPKTPEFVAWEKELRVREKSVEDYKAANPEWQTNRKFGDEARKLENKVQEWHLAPDAPPRAMAMADKAKIEEPHIFLRGNAANAGPQVPRRFLQILSGDDRKPFTKGSGRLELAQAIASRDNPLTARVFVNRVWAHHFGAPLVRTPSDFGVRTAPPPNPELLDFLAAQFMDDGWSVKKLHRRIMLSAVWQQSSDDNAQNRAGDPENQFLWRQNRRRLDFEALRDSMLAVAGQLDLKMGGPGVTIETQPFSKRRTIYAFIDRQNLPGVFRAFDFASPDAHSPQRFQTTVPQQALFLLNSPFVIEQAKALAHRPDTAAGRDEERIQKLYRVVFGRGATPDEIAVGVRFVQTAQSADSPSATVWQYGYGGFDEAAKRVSFTPLIFSKEKKAWQIAKEFPDPNLGYISLNQTGGYPGRDAQHAVIRRWIAPRDGEFAIAGTLAHGSQEGDGVRGRIVSGAGGELGSWVVKYNQVETAVKTVRVSRGETIDFIVDCRESDGFDSFTWVPVIRAPAPPGGDGMEWSAGVDFAGSDARTPSLSPWEKYAQVLLAANEFAFVD